jgi:hypothetical protein
LEQLQQTAATGAGDFSTTIVMQAMVPCRFVPLVVALTLTSGFSRLFKLIDSKCQVNGVKT